MTYSWQNEHGEPIMSGEAWRFEQQLDMDSRDDYYADHADEGGEAPCEANPDVCTGGDLDYVNDETGECSWCGKHWPYDWNA